MKQFHIFIALFFLLTSCFNRDKEVAPGQYENGVLITNEGNFNTGNGSLSFISSDSAVTNDLFTTINSGQLLGDVVQSIYHTDDKVFVIVNNSHVIYGLNRSDLTIAYVIRQTKLPRYMTHEGNIGYFTEWIDFSTPGQLKSFDLSTGQLLDSATVGFGAEFPLIYEGQIFVSNSFESSVSILETSTLDVVNTLETAPSPGQMILSRRGNIYLICGGGYTPDWAPANDGAMQTIKENAIVATTDLGQNVNARMAISLEEDRLFFTTGNQIWQLNLDLGAASQLLDDAGVIGYYGIGVSPAGHLYLGDHAGFQGAGSVLVYSTEGDKLGAFTVGIAPNGFIFLD